jgi:acyl-coenzyme A thioesterase PaaI-like protein
VRIRRTTIRLAVTAAAVAILVPAAFAWAAASATRVTLVVRTGSQNQVVRRCTTVAEPYKVVARARPVTLGGAVTPHPAGAWHVVAKVKLCTLGKKNTVWEGNVKGRADGTFTFTFTPRAAGYYSARVTYTSKSSAKTSSNKPRFVAR